MPVAKEVVQAQVSTLQEWAHTHERDPDHRLRRASFYLRRAAAMMALAHGLAKVDVPEEPAEEEPAGLKPG